MAHKGFKAIDRNKSGDISCAELVDVLKALGTKTRVKDLRQMVRVEEED